MNEWSPVVAVVSGLGESEETIKEFVVSPDPDAVPKVTKDAIQVHPSLTDRQKEFISRTLDDYYQFILKTQRHMLSASKSKPTQQSG